MPNCCTENGRVWVGRVIRENYDALKKLFLRCYVPLCKFVNSSHISEVFIHVGKTRIPEDSSKSVRPYLYQSVRKRVFNPIACKNIGREYNHKNEWLPRTLINQINNSNGSSEFISAGSKALYILSQGAQKIYKLSHKAGLTFLEISEVLGISLKTAESQVRHSLKAFRRNASDYISAGDRAVVKV